MNSASLGGCSILICEDEPLIDGMEKCSTWFDLTTNSPTLVRQIHRLCSERGLHILDAPVSGGAQGAKSGRLAIWVGGEEALPCP
jgi:3-hydroxyisobutyrate dehydrogenase